MAKYSVSTHKYIGSGPTIVAHEGGAEIPAVIFSQINRDFPFDTSVIARNFQSLVNGQSPLEKIASPGQAVYYEGLPGAVVLRFQGQDGGLTQSGLMITVNRSAPDHIVADLENRIDADFMKSLCDAIRAPVPATPAPTTQQTLSR